MSIRYVGLEEELSFFTDDILYLPEDVYYKQAVIVGLIISVFYAIIESLLDLLSRRLFVGFTLLLKSVIYFALIIIVLTSTLSLLEIELDRDLPNEQGWWRLDPFFWLTVSYFLLASVVFSLIRIANNRFGRGNFLKSILGTYKKPKEEERVLMFIDLKHSTHIAEKLGHKKYSEFIQECFFDLNIVLPKYDAEVYQYVGDEAVINWSIKKGFKNNNCINLFHAFQKRLAKRNKHYMSKYNFSPIFKAGIHCGKLIVTEVGTVKKELAFHGDVINTASRIQGLCNKFNALLLISEPVINQLSISSTHYSLVSEDLELKGKEERLKIYSLSV